MRPAITTPDLTHACMIKLKHGTCKASCPQDPLQREPLSGTPWPRTQELAPTHPALTPILEVQSWMLSLSIIIIIIIIIIIAITIIIIIIIIMEQR